jgi:single-strand DNA-binding protein
MAMSQVGYLTLTGYVTAEPRLWHTARTKTPVASVRVGSTPRRLNRATGEWQDGETSYFTVKCWRRLAENVHGSLRKGDMIIVRGKLSTRTWVDDQQRTRTEMQVEADSVGHDLAFGWSRFNRGVQVAPHVRQGIDEGEAARQGVASEADLPGNAQFPGEDEYEDALPDPLRDDRDDSDRGRQGDRDGDQGTGEGRVFAGLTGDLGQPAEAMAPF